MEKMCVAQERLLCNVRPRNFNVSNLIIEELFRQIFKSGTTLVEIVGPNIENALFKVFIINLFIENHVSNFESSFLMISRSSNKFLDA